MYKRLTKATLAVALLLSLHLGVAQANEDVYQKVLPSTVWILNGSQSGSGVLIDSEKKLVVTNFHVVGWSKEVRVAFPKSEEGRTLTDRAYYQENLEQIGIAGRVAVVDPKRDLALIELDKVPEDTPALALAAESVGPGQRVHSIGNPGSSPALWVYSSGTVRQVFSTRFRADGGLYVEARIVETQTPVNPGDSGGPVVNDAGELVAITQSIHRNANLVCNCIDVDELRQLLAGNVKTIDKRVKEALEDRGLKSEVNPLGTFSLGLTVGDARHFPIRISSSTSHYGELELRDVYATAHQSEAPLSAALVKYAMTQNSRHLFGAWEVQLANNVGGEHLVFRVRLDANASPEQLADACAVVTVTVDGMKKWIESEQAKALNNKDLRGKWTSEVNGDEPGSVAVDLELRADDTFTWTEGTTSFTGKFRVSEGFLLTSTVGGRMDRLGRVTSIQPDRFVIQVGERLLNFQRRAVAAPPSSHSTSNGVDQQPSA